MSTVSVLVAWLTARATADRNDRGSAELTTMIALSFVGVVAVVAIVALLQTLGLDVVNGVRDQIGL
jgi:hypothetical protein